MNGGLDTLAQTAKPTLGRRLRWLEPSMVLWGLLIAILIFLVASPLVRLLLSSFQEAETGRFTLANFVEAYGNLRHLQALLNSLELGVGVALLAGLFGVPIAWAISRTDMPAKSFVRVMVLGAFIMPPYLAAISWILLAGPNAGWLNKNLDGCDRRRSWRRQHLFNGGSDPRRGHGLVSVRLRLHKLTARSGVVRDGGRRQHLGRRDAAHHFPRHTTAGLPRDPRRPHHQLPGGNSAVR